MEPKPLRLKAVDGEDFLVLSPLLQDGLIALRDIALLPEGPEEGKQRFAMLVNRYCWEKCEALDHVPGQRVLSSLVFDRVEKVQYSGFDKNDQNLILSLLALEKTSENEIMLYFADNANIRIECSQASCFLQDLETSWPTRFTPQHEQTA